MENKEERKDAAIEVEGCETKIIPFKERRDATVAVKGCEMKWFELLGEKK